MKHLIYALTAVAITAIVPLHVAASPQQLTKNISWEITDSVLHISGQGAMPNFATHTAPWSYQDIGLDIHSIVIDEGITTVGEYAFANIAYDAQSQRVHEKAESGAYATKGLSSNRIGSLHNVTLVHLPSTITKIGAYSFQGLNITHINLPEGLSNIGALAFNLSGLRYVKFPEGLKKIGYSAFESCVNLECVDFSGARVRLPKGAFFDCEQLYQVMNSENITEAHPLSVEASPLEKVNNLIEYFKAPNIDRYLGTSMLAWGEYITANLTELPAMTQEQTIYVAKSRAAWKQSHQEAYSEVLENEYIDSITLEIAKMKPEANAAYLAIHKQLSDRYTEDQKTLVEDYFNTITKANARLLADDMLTIDNINTDNGTVMINSTHHGRFLAVTGVENTREFTDQWEAIARSIQGNFVRRGDKVMLRNVSFTLPSGKIIAAAPIN